MKSVAFDVSQVTLLQRELIPIEIPDEFRAQYRNGMLTNIRHFGVALDNDEAQRMLAKDWRVFGDDRGPFLVVRLKDDQHYPWGLDAGTPVDVVFRPVPWVLRDKSGIICWFEKEVFEL